MSQSRGLSDVLKRLRKLPEKLQKNVMTGAIRAGAKPIVAEMKRLVPVDEGDLKKTIRIKKRRTPKGQPYKIRFSIHAGGTIKKDGEKFRPYYAHMIEFGTSKMAAQPFARPAMESKAGECIEATKAYLFKRVPIEIEKLKND